MKHLLLGIVLIVIGIGLTGARYARSSISTRRGSAAVSTSAPETLWILPVVGVVLIVVGILFAIRVF
jgi:hypothetical protein